MSLIIDGYNLLHAAGIVGRGRGPGGLERSRNALLNFLVAALDPAELPRATVVFDARCAPPGLPRTVVHRGLTVRFARANEDADDLIEELIKADTSPRKLTVVSGDHRLHVAARRRKATPIDSDLWYVDAVRRRRERRGEAAPEPEKPPALVTEEEINRWLEEFSGAPATEAPARDEDPFPADYVDQRINESTPPRRPRKRPRK